MNLRLLVALWVLLIQASVLAGGARAQTLSEPVCITAAHQTFDFWVGAWEVRWTSGDQSGVGRNTVTREIDGCVVQEHYRDETTGFEGTSIFGYDIRTQRWIQVWWDNRSVGFRSSGGRDGDRVVLNLERLGPDAPAFRMVFEDIQENSFVWRFQTMPTQGGEWSDLTVSRYRRLS